MKSKTYIIKQNDKEVLKITIQEPEGVEYKNIRWDSKTGLVTAEVNNVQVLVPYTGNGLGTLEPGGFEASNIYAVSHNYWYY